MPRFEHGKKDTEKTNAQDLAERIRKHKLQKEQEEDEKDEERRRRKAQQEDTEEDDENLKENQEEKREDKKKKKKKKKEDEEEDEEDDDEADDEEDEEEDEEEHEDEDTSSDNQEKSSESEKSDTSSNEGNKDDKENNNLDTNKETDKESTNPEETEPDLAQNMGENAGEKGGAETTGETGTTGAEAASATGTETASTTAGGTVGGTGATAAGGTAGGTGATEAGGVVGTTAGTAEVAKVAKAAEVAEAETAGATTITSAGAGTAGASAAGAGATVAGAGVTGAGIGILGIVLIVILIIIMVVGIIFFFVTMPGMVVGKIGDAINSFREKIEVFFDGNNAAEIFVNREQVIGAAEYVTQMGYDLVGFGFLDDKVTKKMTAEYNNGKWASLKNWWSSTNESDSSNLPLKSFSTKNLQQRKEENRNGQYQEVYLSKYKDSYSDKDIRKHILLAKNSDGDITFAKSKYLATYLSAENAIYLLRNDNTNIFNRAAKLIGMNDTKNGSGLTYFINASNRNITNYVTNASNIKFKNPEGWFGYNRVNIFKASKTMVIKNADDGWFKSSNYTYSLDGWASKYGVPLQLSLALHLSSLAPDFALQVARRGTEDTAVEMGLIENENVTVKSVLFIDIGNGKQYYRIQKSRKRYRFIKSDGTAAVFRGTDANGYFETGNSTPSTVIDAFGGNLSADEIDDFLNGVINLDIDINNFTKYIPIILSVTKHWYQDLDFNGCYRFTGVPETQYMKYTLDSNDSNILHQAEDTIYVEEISQQGVIEQTAEPKAIGEPGEWIKKQIDTKKYYKYDGAGEPKNKSKINFADSAVDAIAMLEQVGGKDSQDIIRMFKELMSSYNIYFLETEGTQMKKDLFSKVIRNYSGTLLTDGEDCVYKANIPPTQTGFDEDLIVQSPAKGKITYQMEDSICIEFTEKSEPFYKYTLLISGFKVNENIGSLDEGTELGKTIRQDLKLVLRDENGAIVKNEYVQTLGNQEEEEEESTETGEEDTRVPRRNPKYTKEQLQKIFTKYGNGAVGRNLLKYVDDFYNLQTKYGVNPLFAAAVTIKEQSAGTASSTCSKQNNWFSVREKSGWASYASPSESIDEFGNMIANGSNYFAQGRYTIKEIGEKYCVPPDEWIKGVSKIMKNLEECNE